VFKIYLITNTINGKFYIGQTRRNLSQRWEHHKSNASTNRSYPLSRAIRKYGPDSFSIQEIGIAESKDDANFLETFGIVFSKHLFPDDVYNATNGGDGRSSFHPSAESREKSRKSNSGKKRSLETRRKLSESHKNQKAWNTGIPWGSAIKQKMRAAKLGKPWSVARRAAHSN
jgi:group I intron endonuclease